LLMFYSAAVVVGVVFFAATQTFPEWMDVVFGILVIAVLNFYYLWVTPPMNRSNTK